MIARLGRGFALAAVAAAAAVAFADSSIVVLALPDLLREFDSSITGAAWVVTSYNLVVAVASLLLVPLARRLDPARLARVGLLVFLGASVACAAANALLLLVAFRSLQGLGAALLLAGSLPLARDLSSRGTAVWAGAGVFGAALGPAAGGLLTELLDWRAIFLAQAPVAALALAAIACLRVRAEVAEPAAAWSRSRRLGANVALAALSAALVGLLFLSVVLLVDAWRLAPLTAAAVISAIPLAALAAYPLAGRSRSAAGAGILLVAGGLAGMALLPQRSLVWAVAALALAGFGLGLVAPRLAGVALSGGRAPLSVGARHAGLVAGLLLLTPLLAADLTAAGDRAKLQATALVLDAPLPVTRKLRLGFELAPALREPPRRGLPSFSDEVGRRSHDPEARRLGHSLDELVQAAVTRSFRRSFLVAGLLALLALAPLGLALPGGRLRARTLARAPAVAAFAATTLVVAELASGALAYGARPRVLDPCKPRQPLAGEGLDAAGQRLALRGLDALACRLGKSREQLVLDAADKGLGAAHLTARVRDEFARGLDRLEAALRRLAR